MSTIRVLNRGKCVTRTSIVAQRYQRELSDLAQATWSLSPTAQRRPIMPPWFNHVVTERGLGMWYLMERAHDPWVVFPDFVPGLSLVAYHKRSHRGIERPQRLQWRSFQGEEALDMDMLVQKAIAGLCRRWIKKHNGMIRLDDDQVLMFVFPSLNLNDVMKALGMPQEELLRRPWVRQAQVNWAAIGLA